MTFVGMNLLKAKCVPCEGGVPPLSSTKIKQYLGKLQNKWDVIEEKRIRHTFEFKDFKDAIKFVNKVAEIAESEGHHPDIYVYYNKVVIELTTHAIDGLFDNDFILAAKIENIKEPPTTN